MLLSLVLTLAVVGVVALWRLRADVQGPPDGDLRVGRARVSDVENAFFYFKNAGMVMYLPEERAGRLDAMLAGTESWDTEFARDVLRDNEDALSYVDSGLACSLSAVTPDAPGPSLMSGPDQPYLQQWQQVAQLLLLRVSYQFRACDLTEAYGEQREAIAQAAREAGDTEPDRDTLRKIGTESLNEAIRKLRLRRQREAFDGALNIVKFGHTVKASGGPVSHYLAGRWLKEAGLQRLQWLLRETTLGAEDLRGCAERLAEYEPTAEALEAALQVEYAALAVFLYDVRDGRTDPAGLALAAKLPAESLQVGYSGLQPNKTNAMLAAGCREFMSRARKQGPVDVTLPRPEARGNPGGKLLCEKIMELMASALLARCHESVHLAATRLMFALRRYKLDNGKLPELLADLVPGYIDEVPQDAFDGLPIRYSAQERIIYSVGEDLKDSGGAEEKPGLDRDEPTFRIEF